MSNPRSAASVLTAAGVAGYLRKRSVATDREYYNQIAKWETSQQKSRQQNGKRRERGNLVDAAFLANLRRLIGIVIPSKFSKETFYIAALSLLLVARTFLSISIATVNGGIVKSIVSREWDQFMRKILVLASIAVPASMTNSGLKYFRGQLSLAFRSRLVAHFHDEYLSPLMYYKVTNIDSRFNNPEQALTDTVSQWASSLSSLYSDVTKPLLDIILFSRKLAALLGWQGPGSVIAYYTMSFLVMRLISPLFDRFTKVSQELEGDFRSLHTRLITYAEEVAFYCGHTREKLVLNERYARIVYHTNYTLTKSWWIGIMDGFLVKYGSVLLVYPVLGLPVFGPGSEEYLSTVTADTSEITRDYIRNSSLLINLARAIGRIVTSYKEVQKLAGYTRLVSNLETVLDDLKHGKYEREMTNPEKLTRDNLKPDGGQRGESKNIEFHEVSIVTPNGDVLVPKLTFTIEHGQNLMIVGPNGCGKSSLFRLLGDLWPLFDGVLLRPAQDQLFYIPQKPYLPIGTFRDLVIYPHTHEEYLQNHDDDTHLYDLLDQVELCHLLERYGGWDANRDWQDTLSGGEKQRVAMARLFYHKPRFAILDECTSAVSVDVEGSMYTYCREVGITLITVSHRHTLWKYHEFLLQFDGRGSYSFGRMPQARLEDSGPQPEPA